MGAVRKAAPAVAKRESRAEEDARFAALAAAEEARQRAESDEQRLERINARAYEDFIIGGWEEDRRRMKSAAANSVKTMRVQRRREAIVALWPKACAEHPNNLTRRHDYIVEQLEGQGFPISVEYMVSVDLPRIRQRLTLR